MEDFSKRVHDELDNDLPIIQNPPHLPQHPMRIIVNGPSGSGKTNVVLNLLFSKEFGLNYHKLYLYAKDLEEDKYEWLIKKMEDAKASGINGGDIFEYSSDIKDVVKVDDLDKDRMHLIIFDDFITEKDQTVIKDLFVRGRKRNCSVIYISQIYHKVPNEIRKNCNYVSFFKPTTNRETSILYTDYGGGLDKKDFYKIMSDATDKPYDFLLLDNHPKSSKEMRYRNGFLGRSQWE